jgi:hypothetical protein
VLKEIEAEAALANCRALINQINAALSVEEPFVNVSSAAELQLYLEFAASSALASRRRSLTSSEVAARAEKVFRPAVIEVLDDPLAAAELGDTVLATQAFQYNADLVFRREVSPRRATDLLHDFCRRFFLRH